MEMTRHEQLKIACIEFHKAHPEVWQMFVRFTFDRISRGFKNYSVNAIFERIRWETDTVRNDDSQFKLNNNYRAFYARAFMKKYPEHEGFFRLREQISKSLPATHRSPRAPVNLYPTN